jgi:hypothetical protein
LELAQGLAMKQYNITKDQNLKKFNNSYVVKFPCAKSTHAKTHNLFPRGLQQQACNVGYT